MKANYPVEFLAASMTLDMGNTDKLAEFRAEAERLGIKVEPPSVNRSGVGLRGRRQHDLSTRWPRSRASAAQAVDSDRRGARRQAVRRSRRFRPPHQSARGQQARAGKPRRRRRLRRARAEPRARASPPSTPCSRPRSARTRPRGRAERHVRRRSPSRETIALPAVEPWLPAERLQREYDAIGFFLSGHPLDDYAAAAAKAARCSPGPSSPAR